MNEMKNIILKFISHSFLSQLFQIDNRSRTRFYMVVTVDIGRCDDKTACKICITLKSMRNHLFHENIDDECSA